MPKKSEVVRVWSQTRTEKHQVEIRGARHQTSASSVQVPGIELTRTLSMEALHQVRLAALSHRANMTQIVSHGSELEGCHTFGVRGVEVSSAVATIIGEYVM